MGTNAMISYQLLYHSTSWHPWNTSKGTAWRSKRELRICFNLLRNSPLFRQPSLVESMASGMLMHWVPRKSQSPQPWICCEHLTRRYCRIYTGYRQAVDWERMDPVAALNWRDRGRVTAPPTPRSDLYLIYLIYSIPSLSPLILHNSICRCARNNAIFEMNFLLFWTIHPPTRNHR